MYSFQPDAPRVKTQPRKSPKSKKNATKACTEKNALKKPQPRQKPTEEKVGNGNIALKKALTSKGPHRKQGWKPTLKKVPKFRRTFSRVRASILGLFSQIGLLSQCILCLNKVFWTGSLLLLGTGFVMGALFSLRLFCHKGQFSKHWLLSWADFLQCELLLGKGFSFEGNFLIEVFRHRGLFPVLAFCLGWGFYIGNKFLSNGFYHKGTFSRVGYCLG